MQETSKVILKILSNSSFGSAQALGLNPKEVRARLLAKSVRIPEYEIIKLLSELRSQGFVRVERNRWYVVSNAVDEQNEASQFQEKTREIATWSPSTSVVINPDGIRDGEKLPERNFSGPWGTFRKLMDYYLDCIRCEEGADAFARFEELGKRFVFLSRSGRWHPKPGHIWKSVETSVTLGEFINAPNLLNEDSVLLLGYPIQFVPFEEGKQVNGALIKPIFTYRVSCKKLSGALHFTCEDPWPDVNLDWLEYAFRKDPLKQRNFLSDCGLIARSRDGETIGEAEEYCEPDFTTLINTLKAHMPKDSLREVLRVESINSAPLNLNNQHGIYNKAIFLIGKRPQYTRNMIAELKEIASASDETLDETSLKYVFKNEKNVESGEVLVHEQTVLEGQDLNFEQRVAVSSLVQRPVSVVTGPPGTGKSQVVVAGLLNTRLNDGSALFTSRNHKAVETVVERFQGISQDQLIVRANSREEIGQSFGYKDASKMLLAEQYDGMAQDKWVKVREELDRLLKERGDLAQQSIVIQGLRDVLGEVEKDLYEIDIRLEQSLRVSLALKADEALVKRVGRLLSVVSFLDSNKKRIFAALLGYMNLLPLLPDFFFFLKVVEQNQNLLVSKKNESFGCFLGRYRIALGKFNDGVHYWILREKQAPINQQLKQLPTLEAVVSEMGRINARLKELVPLAVETDVARRRGVPPNEDRAQIAGLGASIDILKLNMAGGVEKDAANAQINDTAQRIAHRFPLWAVTNLSLRGRIPLKAGLFDLAVIDEASQCDIPSAVPVMFRAKRIAVVGDPQQLCHITKINKSRDLFLRKRKGLSQINNEHRFSYVETSLYGLLAQSNHARPVLLRDTYRSVEQIAEYSNDLFYNGALRVLTAKNNLRVPRDWKPGIEWKTVVSDIISVGPSGCCAPSEVDSVLTVLKDLLISKSFDGTVGVVTPFQQQKRRINDSLYAEIPRDLQERAGLIVDTAHGFQGDQKDVIILSLCGGPGMPAGSLGFISSNSYLLNVAVSRARALLIVVGNKEWAAQCGVKHIERLTGSKSKLSISVPIGKYHPHESPWEKVVFDALVKRRVVPEPQWPVLGRRLDLALINQRSGKKIDIEVDGDAFHRNADGSRKIDDVWRDIMMQADGWKVMRFWVYQLREDLDGCVDKIVKEWEDKDV